MSERLFSAIKRWWAHRCGRACAGFDSIEAWAAQAGWRFSRHDEGHRFSIDAPSAERALHIEWGGSQRSYIMGDELRIRLELNLPDSLQLLVMTRPLMERLEHETFESYTQAAQTVVDLSHPEEMRWLALYPRIQLSFDPVLHARFGALGVTAALGLAWINGPLGAQLVQASQVLLAREEPFVLMILRGRLYLRLQMPQPQPALLTQCLEVLDAAAQSALQLTGEAPAGDGEWSSTVSSGWMPHSVLEEQNVGSGPVR